MYKIMNFLALVLRIVKRKNEDVYGRVMAHRVPNLCDKTHLFSYLRIQSILLFYVYV